MICSECNYCSEESLSKDSYDEADFVCKECLDAADRKEYRSTKLIRTSLWIEAILMGSDSRLTRTVLPESIEELLDDITLIKIMVDRFYNEVWLTHNLHTYWEVATLKGHKASYNHIEVLMWGGIGRLLFTFIDKSTKQSITLITSDPPTKGIGIQSLECTKDTAISLIKLFIEAYTTNKSTFTPDKNVRCF